MDYDGDFLTSVLFPDGRASVFEYDNDILVSVQQIYQSYSNVSGTVTFDYVNDQVTKVTEYGSDDTEGNYIEMEYGSDNGTCRIRQYYSNRRLWQYNNERTRTDYQNRKKNIFSGFGNYRTGYH